jgi:hypothetical protein
MVKEERSLRTRLAAGSKRRIARRIQRRFLFQADPGMRDIRATVAASTTTACTR